MLFALSEPKPMMKITVPTGIVTRVNQIAAPPPEPSQVPHSLSGLPPGGVKRIAMMTVSTVITAPRQSTKGVLLFLISLSPYFSFCSLTQSDNYQGHP